jgi:hypothetical protein
VAVTSRDTHACASRRADNTGTDTQTQAHRDRDKTDRDRDRDRDRGIDKLQHAPREPRHGTKLCRTQDTE